MSVDGGRIMASELFIHHSPVVTDIPQPTLEVRKEREARNSKASWVGEWNLGNMQEVQHQLRALKAR